MNFATLINDCLIYSKQVELVWKARLRYTVIHELKVLKLSRRQLPEERRQNA